MAFTKHPQAGLASQAVGRGRQHCLLFQQLFDVTALNERDKSSQLQLLYIPMIMWLWFRHLATGSQLQHCSILQSCDYHLLSTLLASESKVNGEAGRKSQMVITWSHKAGTTKILPGATGVARTAIISLCGHMTLCFTTASLSKGVPSSNYLQLWLYKVICKPGSFVHCHRALFPLAM